MPALSVTYDGRVWSLDFAKIDVDDMETIEDYTGKPGNLWLEELRMTDSAGAPLTVARLKEMSSDELRFAPPVKVVRCAYWVMLRQAGQPSAGGPAGVHPDYSAFTVALLAAMAKTALAGLSTEVVDSEKDAAVAAEAAFLPKVSPTVSDPTLGNAEELSVPVSG